MNNQLLLTTVFATTLTLSGCDSLLYSNTLAPVFSANKTRTTPPEKLPASTGTGSIEQPGGIIVQQAGNDPYATPTRPVDMTKVTPTTEQSVATAMDTAKAGMEGTAAQASARIKEGSEVLANGGNTATQAVQRPVTTMSQQQAQADKTVSEKAQTTAKETTTAVTGKVPTKSAPATPKTATRALLQEAKDAVASGEYDKAASALERAHRIEPGNAKILYDIAQIRYAQGKYRQASSFASKAATYSSNPTLSKKVWTLLSKSRKKLGNNTGATAAAQKAAGF